MQHGGGLGSLLKSAALVVAPLAAQAVRLARSNGFGNMDRYFVGRIEW